MLVVKTEMSASDAQVLYLELLEASVRRDLPAGHPFNALLLQLRRSGAVAHSFAERLDQAVSAAASIRAGRGYDFGGDTELASLANSIMLWRI